METKAEGVSLSDELAEYSIDCDIEEAPDQIC